MSKKMTELYEGGVFVQVKSKRGTGTPDEDVVIVGAKYSSIEEAKSQSYELNQLVRDRMGEARIVDDSSRTSDINHGSSDQESASDSQGEKNDSKESNQADTSKIYLGEGSQLGGWISVPRQVVFKQIAPLVKKNEVEDEEQGINVNFSSDVPLSGWTNVDAGVVVNQIEPIVQQHRNDKTSKTEISSAEDALVACPVKDCPYQGKISQVIGHLSGLHEASHNELKPIECPVDGCSYKAPLDSIGGHINAIQDDDHLPKRLIETPYFEIVE